MNSQDPHLVFMGSKTLGLSVLNSLWASVSQARWTIVHPDDTSDKRSNLGEFELFAKQNGLTLTIARNRNHANELIREIRPTLGIVCGWYWLIDASALSVVKDGLWGIHLSLLPKYRGASPLVWSIINGEREVGASVFRISGGMDDGDILLKVRVEADETRDIGDILLSIEDGLRECLPVTLKNLIEGRGAPEKQNDAEATFCGARIPDDGLIDWRNEASYIHNFVRAQTFPYPGAYTYLKGMKITVLKTRLVKGIYHGVPGGVLFRTEQTILVACGGGTAIEVLAVGHDGDMEMRSPPHVVRSAKTRFLSSPV